MFSMLQAEFHNANNRKKYSSVPVTTIFFQFLPLSFIILNNTIARLFLRKIFIRK